MYYEVADKRYKDLVINIKTYFNKEENHIICDKRNRIGIIEFDSKKYVVKSFKIPYPLNQIVYRFFRSSKAKRSFINSIKLTKLGIDTAEPIGFIEFSSALKFKESFYISKLIDFDFEIRAVLRDQTFEDRENILKQFMAFTYSLHQKRVNHADYSPGNILVKKTGSSYRFSIVDVNRMSFIMFDEDLRMKNLAKLTNHKEDNELMVRYYAEIASLDEYALLNKLNIALLKQQRYLDNKQRLKKIKGKL